MGKSGRRSTKSNSKTTVTFASWVNGRLGTFEFRENESTSNTLLRVARLWMQPESKQFFNYAERLCRGSKRITTRLEYSNFLLQEVLTAMDSGNIPYAKIWLMSFGLLMEQELKTLIDVIHLVEKFKGQSSNHDEMCHLLRHETPYLVLCFYFCKNRNRLTEWLLKINQTLFVNECHNSDTAFNRCWITIADKSKGTKQDIFINRTTKLKILIALFAGHTTSRCCRIVHRGKSIFLSDGGNEKRLNEIGVREKDVIIVVDKASEINNEVPLKLSNVCLSNGNKTAAHATTRKSSMHRPRKTSTRKSSVNYDIVVSDRVKHSTFLSRVFEEAGPLFVERRRLLNELAIKKCTPKPRKSKIQTEPLKHTFPSISHACVGGKAGKVHFPITVGEPNFLYRSSKVWKNKVNPCLTLDLHGCTKAEAIEKLNGSLSVWMTTAMKDHPYTVNVDIVCGGGHQILSEVVETWIRDQKNVANQFT